MSITPNEDNHVEQPLLAQLTAMGWQHLEGDIDVEYLTERASFREVLLADRLKAVIKAINADQDHIDMKADSNQIVVTGVEQHGQPRECVKATLYRDFARLGSKCMEGLQYEDPETLAPQDCLLSQ
jgi:hypothetical protein